MLGTVAMMSRIPLRSLAVLDFLMLRTIGCILMMRSLSLAIFLVTLILLMLGVVLDQLEYSFFLYIIVFVRVGGFVRRDYESR